MTSQNLLMYLRNGRVEDDEDGDPDVVFEIETHDAFLMIDNARAESADQARKEAAERVSSAWLTTECWKDDLTLAVVRMAILGDSVIKESLITDHIPDIGKKLAIAVKALEYVVSKSMPSNVFESQYSRLQDACTTARDALKEIQG